MRIGQRYQVRGWCVGNDVSTCFRFYLLWFFVHDAIIIRRCKLYPLKHGYTDSSTKTSQSYSGALQVESRTLELEL